MLRNKEDVQFRIIGSYLVKILSLYSKKHAVFGNDPQCRTPYSGRREVRSSEGIKQPLHSVRRPGHHHLGGPHHLDGHHQSGGQLDDHLIATRQENTVSTSERIQ